MRFRILKENIFQFQLFIRNNRRVYDDDFNFDDLCEVLVNGWSDLLHTEEAQCQIWRNLDKFNWSNIHNKPQTPLSRDLIGQQT